MQTTKEIVLRVIEAMPADATIAEMMYELYVIEGIQAGLREEEQGFLVSHADVKRSVSEWLKSSGLREHSDNS